MNPGDQGLNRAVGEPPVSTAPSFEDFYSRNQDAWVRYAQAETGHRDAAEQIVDDVTAHMANGWHNVRTPQSAARHAWKVLKVAVARWLDEHDTESSFVQTTVFDRVTRVLEDSRAHFASMEESLGLFSAISRLPGRQYDSIVLRFVLGYSNSRVADLLGVPVGTVRVNVCHAKKRLAGELGLHPLIETEA